MKKRYWYFVVKGSLFHISGKLETKSNSPFFPLNDALKMVKDCLMKEWRKEAVENERLVVINQYEIGKEDFVGPFLVLANG
jgi:hypothetical protein